VSGRAWWMAAAVAAVVVVPVGPAAAAEEVVGGGVKLVETTSIARVLADPDAYVGKTVRIEGKVLDVCPMRGCWMELEEGGEAGKGGGRLRVKVDDGVIVFPVTARGRLAVAEGTIEALPMTREQYVAWLSHLAEERGERFDPASVGDGPFRVLQLKGTGARIDAP
jgi:hypothetical protein